MDKGLSIPELLQQCSWIDCTVPAVAHMRGGSQARPSPCAPLPSASHRALPAPDSCSCKQRHLILMGTRCLASEPERCLQEGYARWELFRQKGLDLYAAHRNNALKR